MKKWLLLFLALGILVFPWACGKSPTSPVPTPAFTPTPTNWANLTSTNTGTQTMTATSTATNQGGLTSTPTPTATSTATNLSGYTSSPTPTITATSTITSIFTPSSTVTPVPTVTPSSTITPNSAPITQWIPANVLNPNGVAYDLGSGKIYVAEDGAQVQVINSSAGVLHTQTTYGTTSFTEPYGVAISNAGATLFVLDGGTPGAVYAFTSSWGTAGSVSIAGNSVTLSGPEGIAVESGVTSYVYVSDTLNRQVDEFSYDGASFFPVTQWSVGANAVPFNTPSGLALDGSGNLFVADSYLQQIQEYSAATSVWSVFASTDNFTTNSSDVFGLGIDPLGNVYACDAGNSLVQEFSPSGGFEAALIGGSGNAAFASPDGIAFMSPSSPATIIVSDYSNGPGIPYGAGSLLEMTP